jgi:heptaprenylglyceryl phosphate synthase
MVYIEGGSGNFENTVANRLKLVKDVANFAHSKDALLIVGGGVQNKTQVEELKHAGADLIVVSSVLENTEQPKTLMLEFLDAVKDT